MGCRRASLFLAALAAVVTACTEQEHQQPAGISGPEFAPAGSSSNACDYNALNSLITSYFPGSSSQPILALKQTMAGNEPNTPGAREVGFVIMDSIGSLSRQATLNAAAGAALTVGLIRCMFDATDTDEFPDFPASYDFESALKAAEGGAYYVRRHTAENSDPVIGTLSPNDPAGNISGVAPGRIDGVVQKWSDVLTETVLIYGHRVKDAAGQPLDPLEYEWEVIRPNAAFSNPGAVVALCVGTVDADVMVHESSLGFLAWEDGSYICGEKQADIVAQSIWHPRNLASRLVRLLQPQPLHAAALASGSGGTATTFKSHFTNEPVETVDLSIFKPLTSQLTLSVDETLQIQATTEGEDGTETVNGVCVLISAVNNNGVPTELSPVEGFESNCTPPGGPLVSSQLARLTETTNVGTTNHPNLQGGIATFNFAVTKSGAVTLNVSGTVKDRSIEVVPTTTGKLNVKPK